jgi:hypothetical protein
MFDLSFRQPVGIFDRWYNEPLDGSHDGNRSALSGVLVTWDPKLIAAQTQKALPNSLLLDMTPKTAGPASNPCTSSSPTSCNPCVSEPPGCYKDTVFPGDSWIAQNPWTHQAMTGFEDAPLPVGQSWSDPRTGLTIKVLSVSSSGARVTITYGRGAVDVAAPTAPGSPQAKVTGATVTLSWTAATDNVGVSRYVVTRDGKQIQAHVTSTHTTDRPGRGKRVYTVQAVDAAGNVSAPSARVSVTITS